MRRLRAKTATQEDLASLLGIKQGTVSQWETGRSSPSFEQMHQIETHLGLALGAILVAAGLVKVDGVEAAILADVALEPGERELVLDVYRLSLQRSAQRRKPRK